MSELPSFDGFFDLDRFNSLSSIAFKPDGTEIAYVTDAGGQFNVWTQPVRGGDAVRLTAFTERSARHLAWARSGLVVAVDPHGNEQWQPNLLRPDGSLTDLTKRTDVQYRIGEVDPEGRRLGCSGNAERPEDRSVYVIDLETGAVETVINEKGNWEPGPWSADGRRMAVTHFKSNMDQDLYLFDIASRSCRLLTEHEGEEINAAVGFTAGGRLLRVTDRGHEFAWLAEQDLETGELKAVRRGEWDVEAAQVSEDGRVAAWAVNAGGLARFEAVNLETGEELAVADLPAGWCLHFALSQDGRHLAAVIGTGTRPFDLHVADLQEGRSRRLTRSYRGAISETSLVPAELVSYPTFDGRRVPAWLYRPPTGGPLPVLLSIHGGPEAQERPGSSTWVPFYQFLCSRGVAVLAPNIRGSSGYGKSYQTLIHRDWGGGELKDIQAAAEHLAAQDWADRERIAVFGGSFGGFATLSALTRLPDLWACGVDLFGPSNLVTFAKAVPPFWREMMRAWVGDPDEDREMLVERSPITYVDQVRAPLLVIQGATDPRVVKAESDQMVDRLRSLGRDVDYVVFDDEGHGFTRTANQLKAFRHVVDFLAKHLQFAA